MFKKDIHYTERLEIEIIGSCLLESSAFPRVFNLLEPDNFYFESNKNIFGWIKEMFVNNLPVNILSVGDFIIRKKGIDHILEENTFFHLTRLTKGITETAHLEYYSIILKEMWVTREIIKLTSSGTQTQDVAKEIRLLQDKLSSLTNLSYKSDWSDMSELMVGLYKHQDEMTATGGKGVLTGFDYIDRVYGGFFPGQMIVIGARPSVGKSAFAGQMAVNMAKMGTSVGFVSLEMNNNEIAARFAALDTGLPFGKIFRSLFEDEYERDRFYEKVNNSASSLPIYVSDKTDLDVTAIKAKAWKLKHEHGLGCLIIDYLQLVEGDSNANRNRENEVAKMSRGFKIMAKELNIPTIILCQLSREVSKRSYENRHPQLSDFRESGAIEQDADVAMFLHSDFKSGYQVDDKGNSTEGKADLVGRKWRNGAANFILSLEFNGPLMSFHEPSKIPF